MRGDEPIPAAPRTDKRVVIVGGGIQGCCAALALSDAGIPCTLIEQDHRLFNRASTRNEGRVHLGLIYGADRTGRTGEQILEAGLRFSPLIRRWIGDRLDRLRPSNPLIFLVRHDSILSPDEIEAHFERLAELARGHMDADPTLDYLGRKPRTLAERLSMDEVAKHFRADRFGAGFAVSELTIRTEVLCGHIEDALRARPDITVLTGHRLRDASRHPDGFHLDGEGLDGNFSWCAEQVVNATWDRLYQFDAQVDVGIVPNWVHRLKFRTLVTMPEHLRHTPSSSIVQGPFGDCIIRTDAPSYCTWYPHSIRGWSHDLVPPGDWETIMFGNPDPALFAEVARATMAVVDDWLPGAADAEVVRVDAGIILAHGTSDVDDPASDLHKRTIGGVTSKDGWHSVNPCKLTRAPFMAIETARRIRDTLNTAAA